jgi:hypothetical protein
MPQMHEFNTNKISKKLVNQWQKKILVTNKVNFMPRMHKFNTNKISKKLVNQWQTKKIATNILCH